ncbi:MAG: flavin reductase family protein [Microbacterium sp.]|uniref:flavin reductase family protein n=1 Tax=Microbacterium sp. TaxID=51671 RepID=UPI003241D0FC
MSNVFGQFPSGVTVVTCADGDGRPHGATVTAYTAVSLEPRLCQVTLTRRSKAAAYLEDAPFAVNILAADQIDVALHFAGRPCLEEPRWEEGGVAPILAGSAATLSCVPWRQYDGGDHLIIIGEIVDAAVREAPPLVFYRSTFHDLGVPCASASWNGSFDDPLAGWFDAQTPFVPFHASLAAR